MEVIVKIGKTNTMTNTWGKTKIKTDKDKKVENKRITVRFSNQLQHDLAPRAPWPRSVRGLAAFYPHKLRGQAALKV